MFTGIVREVGRLRAIREIGDTKLRIGCRRSPETIEIGTSIACNGICLTVTALGTDSEGPWFEADASAETRARTTLGQWRDGEPINLEPALRLGDELGGHIVSGHIDATGEIVAVAPEGASRRLTITVPRDLARFVAVKGSITVDGISLTVNEVSDTTFGVNIIPHTWENTNLAHAVPGTSVNLEIDLMARYVARLAEAG